MRVICLVPSLTETLLECGVEVVGRTRFCIHPKHLVDSIPTVGGTKGVNWQKCAMLKPDLVVFDREENVKAMADECPYPWVATHIVSIDSVAQEMAKLAEVTQSDKLLSHSQDWANMMLSDNLSAVDFNNPPGTLKLLQGRQQKASQSFERVEYIIWRDPWMAVGPNTFIHSVMDKLGFVRQLTNHDQSYPQLLDQDMQREDTFYLFSSEPYRFLRNHQTLLDEGYNGAIVDGELYSWFGIRSLRGLTQHLK